MSLINLIVVHPFGRSGTIFFQSLLDGHKNILTLPHIGPIYYTISKRVILSDPTQFENEVELFINRHPEIFDTSRGYFGSSSLDISGIFGENNDEHIVTNTDLFKKKMLNLKNLYFSDSLELFRKDFFILVHQSFFDLRPESNKDIKYILYHPHTLDKNEMENLLNDFPNLFFVGMTRNPLSDWNSMKKILAHRYGMKIESVSKLMALDNAVNYIKNTFSFASFEKKIKNKMMIDLIRFHKLNRIAMFKISEWLGIEFHQNMLKSTFCRKLWTGNATNQVYNNTFDENKRDRYENLNEEEVNLYKSLVNDCACYLNYNLSSKIDQLAFDKIDISILDLIKVNIFYFIKFQIKIILRKRNKHNYLMIIISIIKLFLVHFPKQVFKILWNIDDKKRELSIKNKYLRENSLKKSIFL